MNPHVLRMMAKEAAADNTRVDKEASDLLGTLKDKLLMSEGEAWKKANKKSWKKDPASRTALSAAAGASALGTIVGSSVLGDELGTFVRFARAFGKSPRQIAAMSAPILGKGALKLAPGVALLGLSQALKEDKIGKEMPFRYKMQKLLGLSD